MATRVQKKQINNNKIGQMFVSGFVATGTSDIVTAVLVTAASADNVTVIPSAGSESSLGFLVTNPLNKVKIVNSTTKSLIGDLNSNEIFGRIIEAAGIYTLSYFSIQSGVETSISLGQTIDFFPEYNYKFKDFPFDSPIRLLDNITNVVAKSTSSLLITSDTLLTEYHNRIEIDNSSSDVTLTLPNNTSVFEGREPMDVVVINDITNINNLAKIIAETPSNLDEVNQEIILDIELGVRVYFSSINNKYRSTNSFSEKRIQTLLPRSTCLHVPDFDQDNYMKINDTAHAFETIDILQGVKGWIYDRTRQLTFVSATQNSGVEVNFEFTNHKLKKGQVFKNSDLSPVAYNTTFPALFTVKSVVDGDNITVDLLSDPGGDATGTAVAEIIDRSLVPRPFKVSSNPTNDLDTSPPNQDGQFITHLDHNGTVVTESINDLALLPSFNNGGANSNTHIQLAVYARDGGFVSAFAPLGSEQINIGIRINDLTDSLGVINSSNNRLAISFNGANLKLDLSAGEGQVRATGFLGSPGGLSPDRAVLSVIVPQVTIILGTRDGAIQAVGDDINVTQFEDPNNPGTLITMTNNTSKVNFYKGTPTDQFLVEIAGRAQYGTIQAAIDADESPTYPSIIEFLIPVQKIFVDKDETDLLANATIENTERIDLK